MAVTPLRLSITCIFHCPHIFFEKFKIFFPKNSRTFGFLDNGAGKQTEPDTALASMDGFSGDAELNGEHPAILKSFFQIIQSLGQKNMPHRFSRAGRYVGRGKHSKRKSAEKMPNHWTCAMRRRSVYQAGRKKCPAESHPAER